MRTKELSFAVGATINLGNFNSARVDVSEVIELDKGDDVELEYSRLKERVAKRLDQEVKEIASAQADD